MILGTHRFIGSSSFETFFSLLIKGRADQSKVSLRFRVRIYGLFIATTWALPRNIAWTLNIFCFGTTLAVKALGPRNHSREEIAIFDKRDNQHLHHSAAGTAGGRCGGCCRRCEVLCRNPSCRIMQSCEIAVEVTSLSDTG
jgi:hypothetical protein